MRKYLIAALISVAAVTSGPATARHSYAHSAITYGDDYYTNVAGHRVHRPVASSSRPALQRSAVMEAGASARITGVPAPTMVGSPAGFRRADRHTGRMPNKEIEQLRAEVGELSGLLLSANDAAFALAGIIGRILVDAGAVSRQDLVDAIEQKAGSSGAEDYNPLLAAFARAVRMNFPGGRFDLIEGGVTEVDPDRA